MNIYQPKKVEDKISSVDQMLKEMDTLEAQLDEKAEEIKRLSRKNAELDATISPLKDTVAKKELELEKLKIKDFSMNTELSKEFSKLEKAKDNFEESKRNHQASIELASKEIGDQRRDLEERLADANRQLKANEDKERKLNEREKNLDILADSLEEYKQRIIKVGVRRNGGVEVEGAPN